MAQSLYSIISGLSLTTGLKLCLDAGDSASYDPGVQTARWLDTSGNGYDFFRGTSAGGDAAEPTFNGSAGGLSSAEYWTFDGSDYFTYDTTNETWMENLHKDNAKFTILCVFNPVSSASAQAMFSTRGALNGINFVINAAGTVQLTVFAPTTANPNIVSAASSNYGSWNFVGMSVDEAGAAGSCVLNGSTNTFDPTYSVTTTNATGASASIGRRPTNALLLQSGFKISCFAAWEGVALTSTQLTDIYNEISERFYRRTIATVGDFIVDGQDATLTWDGGAGAYDLTANAGSFVLSGQSATILKSKDIAAAAGSFSLSGIDASLSVGRTLTAESCAFSLAGINATLLKSNVLDAAAGAFALGGNPATISYSGQIAQVDPAIVSVLVYSKLGAK